MITPAHLAALRVSKPDTWGPLINAAIRENDIREVPDFLANVLHESGRLGTLRESLNYSVPALRTVFGAHFTPAQAAQYGRVDDAHGRTLRAADQWWIGELAYGGRLGNAKPGSGDGFNFRGAGPMQITGRTNVEAFAEVIGWHGTAEALAERIAAPEGGMQAAGAFWKAKDCDDCPTPTERRRRVNGGLNGLQEVLAIRAEVVRVLANKALSGPPRLVVEAPHTETFGPLSESDALNARSLETARST